jgi:hypothetical protein
VALKGPAEYRPAEVAVALSAVTCDDAPINVPSAPIVKVPACSALTPAHGQLHTLIMTPLRNNQRQWAHQGQG